MIVCVLSSSALSEINFWRTPAKNVRCCPNYSAILREISYLYSHLCEALIQVSYLHYANIITHEL